MSDVRVLAFAGSARRDSFNQKLVKIAALGAEQAGAEVNVINLADYALPIFDEDVERSGTPENAIKLKQLFLASNCLLIAAPEYNSSITPLLKNTIDWVSRPAEGEKPLAAYRGKTASLLATSPGALGGLRGLVHVRSILSSIGVVVLPNQTAVPKAFEAFAEDATLSDDSLQQRVIAQGKELVDFTSKLV